MISKQNVYDSAAVEPVTVPMDAVLSDECRSQY